MENYPILKMLHSHSLVLLAVLAFLNATLINNSKPAILIASFIAGTIGFFMAQKIHQRKQRCGYIISLAEQFSTVAITPLKVAFTPLTIV